MTVLRKQSSSALGLPNQTRTEGGSLWGTGNQGRGRPQTGGLPKIMGRKAKLTYFTFK